MDEDLIAERMLKVVSTLGGMYVGWTLASWGLFDDVHTPVLFAVAAGIFLLWYLMSNDPGDDDLY